MNYATDERPEKMEPPNLPEMGVNKEKVRKAPSGKIILFVMGLDPLREKAQQTLSKIFPGCVLRKAKDDGEAFSIISCEKVNMVLSDRAALEKEGEPFLRRLRENEPYQELPVILFAEHITPELLRKHRQDFALWFLEEDCSGKEIAQVARRLMD